MDLRYSDSMDIRTTISDTGPTGWVINIQQNFPYDEFITWQLVMVCVQCQ